MRCADRSARGAVGAGDGAAERSVDAESVQRCGGWTEGAFALAYNGREGAMLTARGESRSSRRRSRTSTSSSTSSSPFSSRAGTSKIAGTAYVPPPFPTASLTIAVDAPSAPRQPDEDAALGHRPLLRRKVPRRQGRTRSDQGGKRGPSPPARRVRGGAPVRAQERRDRIGEGRQDRETRAGESGAGGDCAECQWRERA